MSTTDLVIRPDDLTHPAVHALLAEHLSDMYATSPAESVHALDLDRLRGPGITMLTAWADGELLGCGALSVLDATHGELKSMRTTRAARGRGVASRVLERLLDEARSRGLTRVSLETGTQEYFAPARRLYLRHGFVECPPFGAYVPDPNSVFFTREL